MPTFDQRAFVNECRELAGEPERIADLVAQAIGHPGWVEAAVLTARAGADTAVLFRDLHLTVYATVVGPGHVVDPHEHRVWAVTGLACGEEHCTTYVRDDDGIRPDERLLLTAGDVLSLPANAIHSSEIVRRTASIHVYGGDLLATDRSIWNQSTGEQHPAPVLPPGTAADANRWLAERATRA